MRRIVYIRTGALEKIFQAETNTPYFSPADKCIVESEAGLEFAEVLSEPEIILEAQVPRTLRNIVRIATEKDIKQRHENAKRETEAFQTGIRFISKKKLDMKLLLVGIPFDRSRITFYFTAEERIDFRELIKDLAKTFSTRIEMRQIGVRDEAKMLGGMGKCGRSLCCTTFLKSFEPVGIRMAQSQDLPLNPDRISGQCGRLMCCLAFEHNYYKAIRRTLPKQGTQVATEKGMGKVTGVNIIKQTLKVELENGQEIELPAADLVRTWWGKHRQSRRTK